MNLVLSNPYRTVGLLVGATAKEQERQVKRLKQFIEAEQDPQADFSFPTFGKLHRTLDKVNEAASKLNLDSDKMNAALFWFYDGKTALKTDEEAFNAIKDADLDQVLSIWTKLTSNGEVSQRNASAYNNLGTLCLSGILEGTNTHEVILEQGISLKLKFLESDFIKELKALATDETYKISKKELQLLFLNLVQAEIEKSGKVTSSKLLDILAKQEFSAKEDFLKGFVLKPIEQIEMLIGITKTKRKEDKTNAIEYGQELFKTTNMYLAQLKKIVGESDLKYLSISDKVSNEILQCSIDYFNDNQEKKANTDYAQIALQLTKLAESLATGNITKVRIQDSIESLTEIIDKELSIALALLQFIKDSYEKACRTIDIQVDELQYGKSSNSGQFEYIRAAIPNVSINWSKVNEMKQNCLDWDKITKLVIEAIPLQSIDKIKRASNIKKLNDYKSLVDFLMDKIGRKYKKRIDYICFWETPKTSPSSEEGIPVWLKMVGALILIIILIKACN